MFRDGTLPPPYAARWYDSTLTTEEIVEFRRAGRPAPDAARAAALEALGLPTDAAFVDAWEGFDAGQILDAIDRGFTSGAQFSPWAATDADITEVEQLGLLGSPDRFDPAKVLAQLRAGRSPEEIAFAIESGIKPKKVSGWMDLGMSAAAASAWSNAEFSAGKAAAWIDIVEDPEVARMLESIGFDAETAREQRPEGGWSTHVVRRRVAADAGAPYDVADEWASSAIPTRKLSAWVATGVGPADAVGWLPFDLRPAEVATWAAHGFTPDDADSWRRAGIDPDVAARRRDAGVRPPATAD